VGYHSRGYWNVERPKPRDLAISLEEAKEIVARLGGYPVLLTPRFAAGDARIVLREEELSQTFEEMSTQTSFSIGECFVSKPPLAKLLVLYASSIFKRRSRGRKSQAQ